MLSVTEFYNADYRARSQSISGLTNPHVYDLTRLDAVVLGGGIVLASESEVDAQFLARPRTL